MKTRWEKILDLDFYTEGPALDREGNLFFTTLTGGAIMKLDRSGNLSEWARMSCPNGHRILENGDHIICDSKESAVVSLTSEGEVIGRTSNTTDNFHIPFNTPNDLVADAFGGYYFTDSVRHIGQVIYVDRSGGQKQVVSGLDYPNGIALSASGDWLFIAESSTNRILEIPLAQPGVAKSAPVVFADLPRNPQPEDPDRMPFTANLPDGMAWDNLGRLWVAHYGMGAVQVLDASGRLVSTVPTGIPATSNLCFSADYHSLYVTGGYAEPGPGCVHRIFID